MILLNEENTRDYTSSDTLIVFCTFVVHLPFFIHPAHDSAQSDGEGERTGGAEKEETPIESSPSSGS